MPTPGPRTIYRYSDDFKATAVRLSQLPGVSVRDVADSLYIHPFMLSRWRKLAREGTIVSKGVEVDKAVAAELKALREVKRQYERLKVMSVARYLAELGSGRSRPRVAARGCVLHLKDKLAKLREQMEKLDAIEWQLQDTPDHQISLTDPDARSMTSSGRGDWHGSATTSRRRSMPNTT